jgi:anthranilate phosphoribosyltransferase
MATTTTTPSSATFKPILHKLVDTPEFFQPSDLTSAFEHIFPENNSSQSSTDPAQIGAFLCALHITRTERRPDIITAAAAFLRSRALKADIEAADSDFVVDIVGTGGDGHNTFNVSTTAGVVAAGAGARVCKVCRHLYTTYKMYAHHSS